MTRSDTAVTLFRGRANCAQAVLQTFAPEHGVDESTAQKLASGFGGGIAGLQHTCGAVTGACMALGLAVGSREADPAAAKDATRAAIREFWVRFEALHGATSCRDLLGVDLNTEEGRAVHAQNKLRDTICVPCVRDAALIVDELLR